MSIYASYGTYGRTRKTGGGREGEVGWGLTELALLPYLDL